MFKRIATLAGVIPLFAAGMALAASTVYNIETTAHNFSNAGSGNQICRPCHTPHHAMPETFSDRLWNHRLTNATYVIRGGGTAAVTDVLDKTSRLCMSCHDGTVALDAYGGSDGGSWTFANPKSDIGKTRGADDVLSGHLAQPNISNDHPVGYYAIYDTNDTANFAGGTQGTNGNWTIPGYIDGSKKMTIYAPTGAPATLTYGPGQYIVTCYTCHNPHGSGVDGPSDPTGPLKGAKKNSKLLRVTSTGSELCLSCHMK